eukprot:scaffold28325_cov205-Amphora_coffeaeformis.AAC.3
MDTEPVVVESNTLTASIVPYDSVRVPLESCSGMYSPRLLWPTTTSPSLFAQDYFLVGWLVLDCVLYVCMVVPYPTTTPYYGVLLPYHGRIRDSV